MRIRYTHNKYNNSKKATEVSDFLNSILAYFYWIPGVGNILAIFGFGSTICENLTNGEGFPWDFQILFIIVYIVDILLLLIRFSINILTDNIALGEQLKEYEKEKKKEILKQRRHDTFGEFLYLAKRALVYFLPINIALVFISILIYGIIDGNWSAIFSSVIVLGIDVIMCYYINEYTEWGHVFDTKSRTKKENIKNENTKISTSSGDVACNKKNTQIELNTVQVKECSSCGEKLIYDSKFCHKCGTEIAHEKYEVCIFDAENKNLRKETREIDTIKFPLSKYAFNNTYYAVEKIRDGKKVRIYYEKSNWEKQVENSL